MILCTWLAKVSFVNFKAELIANNFISCTVQYAYFVVGLSEPVILFGYQVWFKE